MWKRRSSRWSSSRSRGFGARRGLRTRVATRPQLWNRSNFFTEVSLPLSGGAGVVNTFNSAVLLARHSNLGEASAPGRGAVDLMRWLHIGGIVFDFNMTPQGGWQSQDLQTYASMEFIQGITLATDQLDAAGSPNTAATVSWSTVQPPVAQISATIPNTGGQNQDYPKKIHWRKFWQNWRTAPTIDTSNGELMGLLGQEVMTRHGTVNKRIRTKLSPSDGLFAIFSAITFTNYNPPTQIILRGWIQGQIYWRLGY